MLLTAVTCYRASCPQKVASSEIERRERPQSTSWASAACVPLVVPRGPVPAAPVSSRHLAQGGRWTKSSKKQVVAIELSVNQALDDGENKRGREADINIPATASNGPGSFRRSGNTMSEPTVV